MPNISASSYGTWQTCHRLYYFEHILRLQRVKEDGARRFGTMYHAGLETWWHVGGDDSPWKDRDAPFLAAMKAIADNARHIDTDPYDVAKAEAMMTAYHARYFDLGFENVHDGPGEEIWYNVPLRDPDGTEVGSWRVVGKKDAFKKFDVGKRVVEHKCLAGDTRVFDHASGRHWTLAELERNGRSFVVSAFDETSGGIVRAYANPPRSVGRRDALHVHTGSGRTILASENHPFWTTSGWRNADDLHVGEHVAVARHTSSDARDVLTDAAIRVIGGMIADGCIGVSDNLTYTKGNETLLARMIQDVSEVGDVVKVSRPSTKTSYIQFSHIGHVAALMDATSLMGKRSAEKRLPNVSMSDRQAAILIGALWDGDGCVDMGNGSTRIIYGSRSWELCRDIQGLLQRLGILSKVHSTSVFYRGDRRAFHQIKVVTRASKRRFLETIPLVRTAVNVGVALLNVTDAAQGADDRGQPRVDGTIWWDQIVSIERMSDVELFDVEVPGVHTFIAEGIVTHNTTSSEIDLASDYIARLVLDMQATMYIDGARQTGHPELRELLYDISRKPRISPEKATPEEKRTLTKGKGCTECGGRAGGKLGPARGTGTVQALVNGVATTVECPDCTGDGWSRDKEGKSNAPRLHANQRTDNESVDDYRARVRDELASDPDAYYRMATLIRDDEQIGDARANLVTAAGEIESMTKLAEIRSGSIHGKLARDCFTQNTSTCFNIFGRRCDMFAICTREVKNPYESPLYQIKPASRSKENAK